VHKIAKVNLFTNRFILLLRKRLIPDMILLIPQAGARDTLATSLHVIAIQQITGVVAVLTEKTLIELSAIRALVAEFALTCDKVIYAILGIIC
jgi:hypothetical protein